MLSQLNFSRREAILLVVIGLLAAIIAGMAVSACLRATDGWAALSAWSSVIGAVLGFLGIVITAWIAWKSYQSSLISADISSRALNANRSWMMPNAVKATWHNANPNREDSNTGIYISGAIENYGSAPALDVDVEYWLQPISLPEGGQARFDVRDHEMAPAVPTGGELPFHLSILNTDAEACVAGTATWEIRIEVTYNDVLVGSKRGFSATYGLSFEFEGMVDEFGEAEYSVSVFAIGKPKIW